LFNACVLIAAIAMLAWHNAWMAAHGRELSRELKAVGASVLAGERTLLALALVCGLAVLREGAEVLLFLTGLATSGQLSWGTMVAGGALGLAGGAGVSALIYLGLLIVPLRHVFSVTTALITLLAAGLAVQAIGFLHQGGVLVAMTTPLWDTSRLVAQGSLLGRLLQTLIGYTDQPDGAQVLAYGCTIVVMIGLMRWARRRSRPHAI
jgi:high-affinity iron transporter